MVNLGGGVFRPFIFAQKSGCNAHLKIADILPGSVVNAMHRNSKEELKH